jgi:hypothetical protein
MGNKYSVTTKKSNIIKNNCLSDNESLEMLFIDLKNSILNRTSPGTSERINLFTIYTDIHECVIINNSSQEEINNIKNIISNWEEKNVNLNDTEKFIIDHILLSMNL